MGVMQLALRAGRPIPPPPGRFLVLISVRGWVDPTTIVQLEWLGQLKNPGTSSGIESATFRLVTECLNQLTVYCKVCLIYKILYSIVFNFGTQKLSSSYTRERIGISHVLPAMFTDIFQSFALSAKEYWESILKQTMMAYFKIICHLIIYEWSSSHLIVHHTSANIGRDIK
jgi:hypothetical protein